MSPLSATEAALDDTHGGEEEVAEDDEDATDRSLSIFSFLGDLFQVSPWEPESVSEKSDSSSVV